MLRLQSSKFLRISCAGADTPNGVYTLHVLITNTSLLSKPSENADREAKNQKRDHQEVSVRNKVRLLALVRGHWPWFLQIIIRICPRALGVRHLVPRRLLALVYVWFFFYPHTHPNVFPEVYSRLIHGV